MAYWQSKFMDWDRLQISNPAFDRRLHMKFEGNWPKSFRESFSKEQTDGQMACDHTFGSGKPNPCHAE